MSLVSISQLILANLNPILPDLTPEGAGGCEGTIVPSRQARAWIRPDRPVDGLPYAR